MSPAGTQIAEHGAEPVVCATVMPTPILLPVGLRNQQLVAATEVATGLACGCTCPGCGARLVARNRGQRKQAHFAHYQAPECAYGVETALHLLAKEVFSRAPRVLLPGSRGEVGFSPAYLASFPFAADRYQAELLDETLATPTSYDYPPRYVSVLGVALERRTEDIVPDIVLQTPKGELLVEIAVTHFVDEAKLTKLARLGISTIELDLSRVARDLTAAELEQLLLHETTGKRWAFNQPLTQKIAAQQRQLEQEAHPYFVELEARRLTYEREQERARRYDEELAEAKRRAVKPIMEWRIPGLPTANQILSCPRQLRARDGRAYANVEADCRRCPSFRGQVAPELIRCVHAQVMLERRG